MSSGSVIEVDPHAGPKSSQRRREALWAWITHREADVEFSPPWWLAGLAVLAVVTTYVYVAWTTAGPIFAPDEVGMVGASQVIARGDTEWTLAGSGYMPGLAVVLAPAWWFTNDAFLVYHVGLAIGVVASVATIWPLSRIARRVGVSSRPGTVVIAAIIMLFPARALSANYLLAESLLTLVTATACAVAYGVRHHATVRNSALLGALAGLAFLTHGRAVAFLVAAGIWMLVVAGRRWRLSLSFTAAGAIVSLGAWALFTTVASRLYWNDNRLGNTFEDALSLNPGDLLGAAGGSAWYAMAAWPAIAVVGAVVVAKRSRRGANPELLLALALALAFILAFIQLNPAQVRAVPRLDVWVYGRYLDHLLTVLAVVGLAVLVRVRHRALPLAVFVVSGAISAVFLLVTVPRIPVGGYWTDVHVAGIVHMLSESNWLDGRAEPWALLTIAALVIGVLVALLGWMRFVVPVLALLAVTLTWVTDTSVIDPRAYPNRLSPIIATPLSVLPADEPVAFDKNYGRRINLYAFGAHPRVVVPVDLADAVTAYDAIYTGYLDDAPASYGAKRVAGDNYYYSITLWVFPGPLFDTLEAQGLLVDNTAP